MDAANAEQIRTALYRYFDPDGNLLYVGISLSPTYRQSQHRDASCWYERIANMRCEWFDCRQAAQDAERAAIRAEKPEFNYAHNRPEPAAARLQRMVDESRADLTCRVARYAPAYSVKEAGIVTGVGESCIRWAMASGDIAYYPTGPSSVGISGWALIDYMEAIQAGAAMVRKSVRDADGNLVKAPNGEWLAANSSNPTVEAWRAHLAAMPRAEAA